MLVQSIYRSLTFEHMTRFNKWQQNYLSGTLEMGSIGLDKLVRRDVLNGFRSCHGWRWEIARWRRRRAAAAKFSENRVFRTRSRIYIWCFCCGPLSFDCLWAYLVMLLRPVSLWAYLVCELSSLWINKFGRPSMNLLIIMVNRLKS